ncbi:MAG: hypothetical protein BM564_10280 [Bacteroidetes bacterium MedPE-SWsnd-G2]|nr:MAG: hypothetical protein BM564_10280 [Bacteroidetes bacterium MedPE-SWsnd-G2]
MKHHYYFTIITLLTFIQFSFTQNSIGTITNTDNAYNGYTLFAPNASNNTYLINNCGEVVHQWTSTYTPAASVYLLENGNLLRTGKIPNESISFGGVGGKIELFDWDNNLLWEYTYSSETQSQHHDIFPLPNGNILMLAVDTMTEIEALSAGRDPNLLTESKIFNEQIIELQPLLGTDITTVIWEWNIKDHLIQDYDSEIANYGVVSEHPELLNFNFLNDNDGVANWLHFNSIQYNAQLDQIILSSRKLSELYIIDHSTTTEEAAGHTGGTYGKGGDFLFRWGNPISHGIGDSDDQTLFSQHYPHWIAEGLTDEGKIIVFNNGNSIRFSTVDIFEPETSEPGVYIFDEETGYGPSTPEWTYEDEIDPENFFSSILSSAQRLPNGNTLVCDGDSGYFFELDNTNTKVWEYVNPDSATGILTQNDEPTANLVFRALKFPIDYPAFTNRDLTPGDPIELDFDISDCLQLSTVDNVKNKIALYPNPAKSTIKINTNQNITKVEIFNNLGQRIASYKDKTILNIEHLKKGIYIIKVHWLGNVAIKKIIKN